MCVCVGEHVDGRARERWREYVCVCVGEHVDGRARERLYIEKRKKTISPGFLE